MTRLDEIEELQIIAIHRDLDLPVDGLDTDEPQFLKSLEREEELQRVELVMTFQRNRVLLPTIVLLYLPNN